MIQTGLLVKALLLVGLSEVLAGFRSLVAFKSLAQKMHSALVFFLDASALCTDPFAEQKETRCTAIAWPYGQKDASS